LCSLIPRPFKRRKGLVHTARTCVGVSIATDHVTIVISHGFCTMSKSMDDKRTVYNYPIIFWGLQAHARAVCTWPFLLLLKGLGMRLGIVQMTL
jgi:hypothetical protein